MHGIIFATKFTKNNAIARTIVFLPIFAWRERGREREREKGRRQSVRPWGKVYVKLRKILMLTTLLTDQLSQMGYRRMTGPYYFGTCEFNLG
jgi:hypothetical protein